MNYYLSARCKKALRFIVSRQFPEIQPLSLRFYDGVVSGRYSDDGERVTLFGYSFTDDGELEVADDEAYGYLMEFVVTRQ